ncbi:MAG TPA: fumarylacetoacetate hydrolase family protein [Methylomirabilota bacterium]|jgi:2-keto-4-pentenoate hydratase
MALRATARRHFAEALLTAETSRSAIPLLTDEQPDLTVADAYRIQLDTLLLRRRAGERRAGWKVGCTSVATRSELGIDEPISGYVLASAVWPEDEAVPLGRFIAPGLEPEIAVVLGRDVAGPRVTPADVLRATDGVTAALEVVDSRFGIWKCGAVDAVADNAFAAGVVLAGALTGVSGLDLRLEGVVVEHNGRIIATAAGAAALGHPVNAVVWLANHLATLGSGLKAGDVVLTGSLTRILRPQAGDTVHAAFTRVGSVGVRFL